MIFQMINYHPSSSGETPKTLDTIFVEAVNNFTTALSKIPENKQVNVNVSVHVDAPKNADVTVDNENNNSNGGGGGKIVENRAEAKGTKTLMGELGPEMVVSNGRYYVVGQNGAEMVDLPDDAIVFNHLQTKRLLNNGISSRGKAITSEKKAVARAKGTGPAKSNASALLANLKAIRDMWSAMLNADVSQLG